MNKYVFVVHSDIFNKNYIYHILIHCVCFLTNFDNSFIQKLLFYLIDFINLIVFFIINIWKIKCDEGYITSIEF